MAGGVGGGDPPLIHLTRGRRSSHRQWPPRETIRGAETGTRLLREDDHADDAEQEGHRVTSQEVLHAL
jgi:hypothetical protein